MVQTVCDSLVPVLVYCGAVRAALVGQCSFLVSMYISVPSFSLRLSLSRSPLLLGCFTFSSVAEAGLGKQTV